MSYDSSVKGKMIPEDYLDQLDGFELVAHQNHNFTTIECISSFREKYSELLELIIAIGKGDPLTPELMRWTLHSIGLTTDDLRSTGITIHRLVSRSAVLQSLYREIEEGICGSG